ncbi:unnamed protein product [Prunus armeniaca]
MRGLHKVLMWDFVQIALVVTRVLEIRFGSQELRQSGASAATCSYNKGRSGLALLANVYPCK